MQNNIQFEKKKKNLVRKIILKKEGKKYKTKKYLYKIFNFSLFP